MARISFD
ncbi:hypothetical protein RDI58_029523 [Solanum bulbocastanum]